MKLKRSSELEFLLEAYSFCEETEDLELLKKMLVLGQFKDYSAEELLFSARHSPHLEDFDQRFFFLEFVKAKNQKIRSEPLSKLIQETYSMFFNKLVKEMTSPRQLGYYNRFGKLSPEQREVLFKSAVKKLKTPWDIREFSFFKKLSPQERRLLFNKATEVFGELRHLKAFSFFGELSPEESQKLYQVKNHYSSK